MEFIPLLRLRKNAMRDCMEAEELPLERRLKLRESVKLLETVPWISKGVVVTTIVLGVDWKKTVPMTKREVPLALGAIAFCALSDYLTSEWAWRQHEVEVVRLTGFKNGIYVNPERMRQMREKMKISPQLKDFSDDDLLIENDDL
jgi:hypothetical protein